MRIHILLIYMSISINLAIITYFINWIYDETICLFWLFRSNSYVVFYYLDSFILNDLLGFRLIILIFALLCLDDLFILVVKKYLILQVGFIMGLIEDNLWRLDLLLYLITLFLLVLMILNPRITIILIIMTFLLVFINNLVHVLVFLVAHARVAHRLLTLFFGGLLGQL